MALEQPVLPTPPPSATPPAPTPPSPAPAPPAAVTEPPTTPPPDENPFKEVFDKAEAHIKKMDDALPKPAAKVEPKVEAKPEPKTDPKARVDDKKPKSEQHKLRDELDARTAELTTFKENHAKLESKLKELETKGQDTEKVMTRIAQLEKERDEIVKDRETLAAKLKVIRLSEDPEFKKQFDDRFNKEAASTSKLVSTIHVVDAEGNPVAPASFEKDFRPIYWIYKDDPAAALATMKKAFGPDATTLLFPKLQKLWEINEERDEKIKESESKAAEMTKQEEAQAVTRKQQLGELWKTTNKELQERNADFQINPTDAELAEARNDALRIFDGTPANDQQRLVKNAYIRQLVGMSPVQKLRIARLTQENATLKAELESLKNPTPPPSKRASSDTPGKEPDEDWAVAAKRELT